jgi:steroid delta-isomerase-like uncharacterized protein
MIEQANLDMVARHLKAENEHRMEETLATLHPECVFEDVPRRIVYRGRGGARDYYDYWWKAFDFQVRGKRRHFTDEGLMVAETNYVGRHVGEFVGIAPTGRPIELPLVVFIGFRDGLMDGERFYYDLAGLLRQLGVESLERVAI